jgi:hypothetical protein
MAVRGGLRPSRPEESKKVSEELWALMARCWDSDPSSRPSMRTVEEDVSILRLSSIPIFILRAFQLQHQIIRKLRETLSSPIGFLSLNSFRKLTFYEESDRI